MSNVRGIRQPDSKEYVDAADQSNRWDKPSCDNGPRRERFRFCDRRFRQRRKG